ncbi:MAG: gliding motility-associated C-terminal domain-containing protein [Bacteroidetes bacterium]|nr:gliding motility-associated C-terminal domain-containing protein [Bacteroidota bacterium]
MNLQLRSIPIVFALWLLSFSAQAAHIVGSEVSYRYLGGNEYEVTFNIIRDANSGGAPFDNPLTYTVRRIGVDTVIMNRNVTVSNVTQVPASNGDPCVIPPPNYIIQLGTYVDTITLPFDPVGYYVTYQRCCWANDILNIVNPSNTGLTVTTQIPGTNLVASQNSSPKFKALPPIVICTNKEFVHDYSANDSNADSLAYKLCDPLAYAGGGNNSPNPDLPRPYAPVNWVNGYSATLPFGAQSPVALDVNTGLFSFTPVIIGRHLASVCIEEWRNGILINEKSSIVNFEVQNCTQAIPFEIQLKNEGIVVGGEGTGTDPNTIKILSEDCGVHFLEFSRTVDTTEVTLYIDIVGTVTVGVDIPDYPDSIVIPKGTKDSAIAIYAFYDGINEPTENFVFSLRYFNPCSGEFDTISSLYVVYDYRKLLATVERDSINFCPELGEFIQITGNVTQGIPPYQYDWYSPATEFLPDVPSFQIGDGVLSEPATPFYFTVTDQCMKDTISPTIMVYDQCPIIVPNVITLNGDYINDVFVIKNLEDYDAVKIKIFNRWGKLLYQNDEYKNNWTVEHKDGTPLIAGIYYYQVEVVNSSKYEYDDNGRTIYQATGFFHVLTIE